MYIDRVIIITAMPVALDITATRSERVTSATGTGVLRWQLDG